MTRAIGNTPFRTRKLALGCVTFGREINQDESFGILDYALEKGITLLDTAEAYGGGQAKALPAQCPARRRREGDER